MTSMWRAEIGHVGPAGKNQQNEKNDDWETDPDFVNDISEKESRWGAKTVEGSGHQGSVSMDQLRMDVLESDQIVKDRKLADLPKPSEGYGGKFGVQKDRMDKSAETWQYKGEVDKHVSQVDYSKGFGGKYGVESDRKDKSALGWDEKVDLAKHDSQKDYAHGFGGKFGLETDRQDKSAAGWDEKANLAVHDSQKDYSKGFGGKYGIESDRQDKTAVGWDYEEKLAQHDSQKDYASGFGGKHGVQKDRQDESALGYNYHPDLAQHQSQKDYSKGFGGKYGLEMDRKDKSAAGYEEHENVAPHESQTDYKKGFGGVYGLETDRKDKSAAGYDYHSELAKHESQVDYSKGFGGSRGLQTDRQDKSAFGYEQPQKGAPGALLEQEKDTAKSGAGAKNLVGKGRASNLRAKFEQLATDDHDADRAKREKERRSIDDEQQRVEQQRLEIERQKRVDAEWQRKEQLEQQMGPEAIRLEEEHHRQLHTGGATKRHSHSRPFGAVPIMPGVIGSSHQSEVDSHEHPTNEITRGGHHEHREDTHHRHEGVAADYVDEQQIGQVPMVKSDPVPTVFVQAEQRVHRESTGKIQQEIDQHSMQHEYGRQYDYVPDEEIENVKSNDAINQYVESIHQSAQEYQTDDHPLGPPAHPMADTGLTAIAIFDYQKQDDDEISFEPDDVITNIEQIDAGWWRGQCNNQYGLFPANYVQLR